jgi:mannose-1-phosphate guanylyltransferase
MVNDRFVKGYLDHLTFRPDRYGKSTLFENGSLLVGLNCLNPGQAMEKHAHKNQTRFYSVMEGTGSIRIGEEEYDLGPGKVAWIPPGNVHQIQNSGDQNLVLLVGMTTFHDN